MLQKVVACCGGMLFQCWANYFDIGSALKQLRKGNPPLCWILDLDQELICSQDPVQISQVARDDEEASAQLWINVVNAGPPMSSRSPALLADHHMDDMQEQFCLTKANSSNCVLFSNKQFILLVSASVNTCGWCKICNKRERWSGDVTEGIGFFKIWSSKQLLKHFFFKISDTIVWIDLQSTCDTPKLKPDGVSKRNDLVKWKQTFIYIRQLNSIVFCKKMFL